jgi:endonuclease III
MKKEELRAFVQKYGTEYSKLLDIRLKSGRDAEIFKWFLASALFGAPITENAVTKTYKCFRKYNVLTPKRTLETGWDGLVKILDEGGYTRYDFKTADKLLEVMKNLMEKYGGSLNALHEKASGTRDLEEKLKALGKGIGNVTVSIFLRELRHVWDKAKPKPTSLVILAAKNLELIKNGEPENVLRQLEQYWNKNKIQRESFVNFETALVRLGKDFCRKKRCKECLVRVLCRTPVEL